CASLVSMYFVNVWFFVALATWMSFFIYFSYRFSKRVRVNADAYASSQSAVSGQIVDSITNAQNVRIFSANRYENQYLQTYLTKMRDCFQKKEGYLLKFYFIQGCSITLLIAVMLLLLIHLKAKGLVTIGDFALILTLSVYVTDHSW